MEVIRTGKVWTWTAASLLAAGALSAGFVFSFEQYLALPAIALLLAAGSVALVIQLDRPIYGLWILVAAAVVFPLEFPGPSSAMVSSPLFIAAFICAVWLIDVIAVRKSLPLDRSSATRAVVFFMAAVILAFVASLVDGVSAAGAPFPAQVAQLGLFLLSGLLFLSVVHLLSSRASLEWLTWTFLGTGLIAAVMQSVPALTFVANWTSRPGSVGSLFWTWLAALSVAQGLLNRKLNLPVRFGCMGLTALIFFHGIAQARSWASGWIPPLAAVSLIALLRFPKLAVSFGVLMLPVGLYLGSTILAPVVAEEAYSLMTRTEASAVLWTLFEEHPVVGMGPVNYYHFTDSHPLLGWYVRFFSHNNYMDLLLQVGSVGFLAFLWFAVAMFRTLLSMYRVATEPFSKAYVAGAIGGLGGSLLAGGLGDWIIPFYYNAGILGFRSSLLFWVFLGGAVALRRIQAFERFSVSPPVDTGFPYVSDDMRTAH